MCKLLLILALIGPILPTPVPLDYFIDFHADVIGRDLVALRDGAGVLASATVEGWRAWLPDVRRAP